MTLSREQVIRWRDLTADSIATNGIGQVRIIFVDESLEVFANHIYTLGLKAGMERSAVIVDTLSDEANLGEELDTIIKCVKAIREAR